MRAGDGGAMTQLVLPLDGFCCGPLFSPPVKRRAPKPRMQSTHRDRVVRARIPPWSSRNQITRVRRFARLTTVATGVQHSVDHIVPINHPLVCGLHCPENLRIVPLTENIRKGNAWWPDMWGVQEPLL